MALEIAGGILLAVVGLFAMGFLVFALSAVYYVLFGGQG